MCAVSWIAKPLAEENRVVRLHRYIALCLLLFLPCGARADDLGPVQAQALQQQLKDWFAGLLGPAVKLPEPPWRITGEHDHYVITWPIPGLTSPAGEVATTANVRPLDGGRWSIDAMKTAAVRDLHHDHPECRRRRQDASMDMQFSVGRQDTHGVIDPGFASASTLHTEFGDLVVSSTGAQQRQEQRFDRYVADTTLTPTQNGRLDLTMTATVEAGNPPRRSAAVRR